MTGGKRKIVLVLSKVYENRNIDKFLEELSDGKTFLKENLEIYENSKDAHNIMT